MLKDMLNKIFNKNKSEVKERITRSLADGYVDVKAYRFSEDGAKKLVYHDAGDNVVTDWMRTVILQLLMGYPFSATSNEDDYKNQTVGTEDQDHTTSNNKDGYVLNGEQYKWDKNDIKKGYINPPTNFPYALYPTKILFGTGKEYSSWESLKNDNVNNHPQWYNQMLDNYGSGVESTAVDAFDALVKSTTKYGKINNGVVSVNDPETEKSQTSTTDFATTKMVKGAIKSCYLPGLGDDYNDSNTLDTATSDQGRMIRSNFRGCGKPSFLYINKWDGLNTDKKIFSDAGNQIYLTQNKGSSGNYNRITFKITMPSQGATNSASGEFYPYNGFQLKQVGLYNDSINFEGKASDFPYGTLLAVKNISPFTKTAEEEIVITWTLTI